MKAKIVHYAIGQRYTSTREDGRDCTMIQIACTGKRVFLPKGHDATHSWKVTCKGCLERLIEHCESQIISLREALNEAVDDNTQFMITRRERGKESLRQMFGRPDAETLERLKL